MEEVLDQAWNVYTEERHLAIIETGLKIAEKHLKNAEKDYISMQEEYNTQKASFEQLYKDFKESIPASVISSLEGLAITFKCGYDCHSTQQVIEYRLMRDFAGYSEALLVVGEEKDIAEDRKLSDLVGFIDLMGVRQYVSLIKDEERASVKLQIKRDLEIAKNQERIARAPRGPVSFREGPSDYQKSQRENEKAIHSNWRSRPDA